MQTTFSARINFSITKMVLYGSITVLETQIFKNRSKKRRDTGINYQSILLPIQATPSPPPRTCLFLFEKQWTSVLLGGSFFPKDLLLFLEKKKFLHRKKLVFFFLQKKILLIKKLFFPPKKFLNMGEKPLIWKYLLHHCFFQRNFSIIHLKQW